MIIKFLPYIQIAVSLLLIAAILVQRRGTGLGAGFGGDSLGSYATRRGLENVIFWASVILGIVFLASAFLGLILK
jgi:protein translocase SecG subunit